MSCWYMVKNVNGHDIIAMLFIIVHCHGARECFLSILVRCVTTCFAESALGAASFPLNILLVVLT